MAYGKGRRSKSSRSGYRKKSAGRSSRSRYSSRGSMRRGSSGGRGQVLRIVLQQQPQAPVPGFTPAGQLALPRAAPTSPTNPRSRF